MKKTKKYGQFIGAYCGMLAVTSLCTALWQRLIRRNLLSFDEINVHRINVIEPDGTLRLVITNNARHPGGIIKGKEYPHPWRKEFAGFLFYNDEGTECGGLGFGGKKESDGKVRSFGSMAFDQYMQDELIGFGTETKNGEIASQIVISDQPDYPISETLEEAQRIAGLPKDQQDPEWKKYFAGRPTPHQRLTVGRDRDQSVAVRLKDIEGRDRIVMMVSPDGTPLLQFFDEQGNLTHQMPQTTPA